MSDLVVLVPVLARPHRVEPLLHSIHEHTTPPYRVLFIASPGDELEIEALWAHGAAWMEVDGNYATKINAAVRATTEPLIFLGADDLEFHPRWREEAEKLLGPQISVVGTNDLCNRRVMRGQHATHSLLTRSYAELGTIDDPARVLHEGYRHEFCDDEFVGTAIARGAFAHARDSIVEHLHPMVGKAPTDALYDQMGARMAASRDLFRERQPLWT